MRTDDRLKLTALALATRQRLWETPFRGYWGWTWFQEPFTWPIIAGPRRAMATRR